ncbi:TB2/DP1, HVA22 family-domain-containing protein [Triangularia verruculosa]|uniref:Protein YOP1 n=1 Tax=Triangularia verruculosa TaxID=2587418 RepID=A0AAN6X6K5_9PEZI|nr:TB2/DP1, HVA22 family-domain-containing protein [Triangularia verruculosa]
MFDIFANLLSSIASFLFPLFASYKALKTSDPAQLTPWLMYWVVLACALLVESWTGWFLCWLPFYAYLRFFFLLYLVLPQTQGARYIYEEYVHPKLEENETAIEEFIASAHDRLKAAGIAYLKQAIEYLKTQILGFPPSPDAAAASSPQPTQPQTPQSYTQSLLAKFTLPSARWGSTAGPTPPSHGASLGSDFYSFLASAVSAASSAAATPSAPTQAPQQQPASWSSIIPPSVRTAGASARMSFIQAQRERLNMVMSALDREEQAALHDNRPSSMSLDGSPRSLSGQSVTSGLSKSRSEQDFEKLEAESGDEDDLSNTKVHRRQVPERGTSTGGWMPWAWGQGLNVAEKKDENQGRSSGFDGR